MENGHPMTPLNETKLGQQMKVSLWNSNMFLKGCAFALNTLSFLKTTTNSSCVCTHLANKADSDSDSDSEIVQKHCM